MIRATAKKVIGAAEWGKNKKIFWLVDRVGIEIFTSARNQTATILVWTWYSNH